MNQAGSLADFTSPELICARLRAVNASAAIRELAELLGRAGKVRDPLRIEQLAMERESLAPTDCEEGMALPHARVEEDQSLLFAAGRSEAGLGWGVKPERVRLVFLLIVPENRVGGYLRLISGLARLARQRELLESMFRATDQASLLALLAQVPLRSPAVPARPAVPRG